MSFRAACCRWILGKLENAVICGWFCRSCPLVGSVIVISKLGAGCVQLLQSELSWAWGVDHGMCCQVFFAFFFFVMASYGFNRTELLDLVICK